jgi:hypothetical protein
MPQLFGSTGLDPSFCQDKTFRQTVVYIDDMSIQEGQTQWAVDLESKLKASLTPGERVTIVELYSQQGTSQELWSGCYPDYTTEQRQAIAKKTYFFSGNPLNGLKNQQGFFMNAIGQSITKVYQHAQSLSYSGRDDAANPNNAEIIEALAADGARYSQTNETIRAIVYTNGAQNSSIGNVFTEGTPPPTGLGQKLGTYFRHSVFYLFGIGSGVTGDSTYLADAKSFWVSALGSMDAPIVGFGSDLTVANEIPVASYIYTVHLTVQGNQLFGKLSLMVDGDGNLIDSWIGVDRLALVGISGTFLCPGDNDTECTLNADTNGGLTTKSDSEALTMSGDDASALKGTEGVQGAMTFPISATVKSE